MGRAQALHRYATIVTVATFLLLIAGSLVTSTDSGLAVPDWPLSYGMLFPPMVGGVLYEHGHRMVAAAVGLMILGLALWLRASEPRRWVRRLGYAALGAVFVQALLGGLTVKLLLPPAVSIAHACLAQAVFCLIVATAYATSPNFRPAAADPPTCGSAEGARRKAAVASSDAGRWGDDPLASKLAPLGLLVAVLASVQLLLGAVIRHTGYGVAWHMNGAFILLIALSALASLAKRAGGRTAPWFPHVKRMSMLIGAQIILGFFVYMHRGSAPLRTAHVALGSLALAQSVVLAWELRRASASRAAAATT